MAFELASMGLDGLETVVPVAGLASWYDYANSQGIPSGLLARYDAVADLSALCASRFPVENETLQKHYEDYLAYIRDQQIELQGDYGPFWQSRDYSGSADFKASALIVQGLNDDIVHPKQFDLMRRAFQRCGCEVKCLLHQNGHVTPANEQTRTDILIDGHTYTEWLNLWFSHYLLGVDNEISQMPDFIVQSNVNGEFYGTNQWMTGNAIFLPSGSTGDYIISAANAHMSNSSLLEETLNGRAESDHLIWALDIPETKTIDGIATVHLRNKTDDADRSMIMLGTVLVDYSDKPFPGFDVGSIGVLDQQMLQKDSVKRGEEMEYDLVEWKQVDRNRKIMYLAKYWQ